MKLEDLAERQRLAGLNWLAWLVASWTGFPQELVMRDYKGIFERIETSLMEVGAEKLPIEIISR